MRRRFLHVCASECVCTFFPLLPGYCTPSHYMECYAVVNRVYLRSLLRSIYNDVSVEKKYTFQPECRTSYIIPLYIIIIVVIAIAITAQTINGWQDQRIIGAHEWNGLKVKCWESVKERARGRERENGRRWMRGLTHGRAILLPWSVHTALTLAHLFTCVRVCVYVLHCTLLAVSSHKLNQNDEEEKTKSDQQQ